MQVTSSVARVTEILHDRNDMGEIGGHVYYEHVITFQADILSGDGKGQSVKALQKIDNLTGNGMRPVSVGDKIFLFQTNPEENIEWEAGDFYRSDSILILAAVFLLGLLVFGRSKGLKTILSLVFTCLAIFVVFVPAILAGYNAYFVSIITCLFTIAMTLALVSGPSRKSLSAALGCAGGVMVAGILSFFMDHVMKLTGYLNDETMYVSLLNESSPIDLRAIIFAAIIIGAMGATMDVAMDITSSLFEIHRKIPDISFWHLVQSGFNIGRDIMGTMANTLVLAYVGSSLHMILLLLAYNNDIGSIINRETIAVELLQSVAGSIGILLTVPSTAAVTVLARRWFLSHAQRQREEEAAAEAAEPQPLPEPEQEPETGGMCGSRSGCSGGAGRGHSRAGSAPDGGRTVAGIPKEGKITGQPGKTGSFPMGRRCFAKKAILFLYW